MAIRSNAGTGVIVSLVVFVLATVFLLVLSIVFYASGREQAEKVNSVHKTFEAFASKKERSSDAIDALVTQAKNSNQSLVSYLKTELEERNRILTGNKNANLADINTAFRDTNSSDSSLDLTFGALKRELDTSTQAADSYLEDLKNAESSIQSLEDQLAELSSSKVKEINLVRDEWQDVQDQSVKLNTDVNDLFTSQKEHEALVRNDFEELLEELEDELQIARDINAQQASNLKDLRLKSDIGELYKTDPSLLIDGLVLEAANDNLVYINRGLRDNVRLGMSFEVYDSANQLREDKDGSMPQGKASIEIVKVGETTSTAKIKRSTPNQPILKDNILVNAIYDPNYKFTFLVHGVFDADGDGNPETSNDFIKNRIKSWGGVVVEDNGTLPGDLDFLVLGIAPKEPLSKPSRNASDTMLENYATRQLAYRNYIQLLEKARSVDIPVLTANRLQILTGQQTR